MRAAKVAAEHLGDRELIVAPQSEHCTIVGRAFLRAGEKWRIRSGKRENRAGGAEGVDGQGREGSGRALGRRASQRLPYSHVIKAIAFSLLWDKFRSRPHNLIVNSI